MPRQPKLRKKQVGNSVYWFTKAGGDTYFGTVDDVAYKDAKKLFADHVQSLQDEREDSKKKGFTAGDLIDLFLEWISEHRSKQTYTTRTLYCSRFASLKVGNARIKELPANKIKGADLDAFLKKLKEDGLTSQTRLHAETSIRACWNWATKHPSPTPYLPQTYRPFSSIERTHVARKALTEADLLTKAEVESAFYCAELDPDQFRRHGLAATIKKVGEANLKRAGDFAEFLKCYYHTGSRTDELARCEVADFLPQTRQVVLGRHKRSRTQRTSTVRHITLNDEAFQIFERHCQGKQPTAKVFLNADGGAWSVRNLAKRFERVKEIAQALKRPIREDASIYDFRHLWISEAMMGGIEIFTAARMAGTSIAMIERVYGHFSNEHLQKAQEQLDQSRKKRGG